MSETREAKKARAEFIAFLRKLDACPAVCIGPNEPDSVVESVVEVDRTAALDCFLRKYPSYEPFRDHLTEVRRDLRKFVFNKESWNKVCGQ